MQELLTLLMMGALATAALAYCGRRAPAPVPVPVKRHRRR